MFKTGKGLSPRRWRRASPPGGRPGEFTVDPTAPRPRISVFAYGESELFERGDCTVAQLPVLLDTHRVTWVNVEGLGDHLVLEELARLFAVHPLALEDVVNVPQRPKVEAYEEQLFLIVQMLSRDEQIRLEQLSVCVGERFVLTFQERLGDPFDPVRKRLRSGRGRLRQNGSDYLTYALLDTVIDHYFPVLEELRVYLEDLEDELRSPQEDGVAKIRAARAELLEARRAIGPLRDAVRSLVSGEWPLVTEATRVFLRDCRDHVLEASEVLESSRESASGLMDIYLSTMSQQANHTMKILTVIATIFMPLSFLAGVYGMNFDPEASPWNMPELSSPIGYPLLLAAMAVIGLGLACAFWLKGWFK